MKKLESALYEVDFSSGQGGNSRKSGAYIVSEYFEAVFNEGMVENMRRTGYSEIIVLEKAHA